MREQVQLGHGQFYGAFEKRRVAGSFSLSTLSARPHVDPHTHSEAHFIFVLKGTYVSSARGADEACGTATLIYNPPGTSHYDRFLSTEGRFFGLSVPADELATLETDLKFTDHAHRIAHPRALALAAAAAASMSETGPPDDATLESLSLELLWQIAPRQSRTDRSAPPWLARACEMIADGVSDGVSVAGIAGSLGVHPVHLARVFRSHLGTSPGGYARRCRIERATERLLRTRQSLADIAMESGYSDQSHFTREFARETGQTPARFRAALS